jgi:uncharacterized membrane protein YccC
MDLRPSRLTARAQRLLMTQAGGLANARAAVERDSRTARLRAEAEAALDRAEAADAQPPSRAVAR